MCRMMFTVRPIQNQNAPSQQVVQKFKGGIRHGKQLSISVNGTHTFRTKDRSFSE